ncbi:MAG: hybrid sensor histidine kinase/response regulator [bacterium]|nr:hybrid sensor histidine kinase/response regulator [bacterium]
MYELQLPGVAFFFSMLLFIVYFFKERVKFIENKVYSVMIVMGLIDSSIICFERLLVVHGDINKVTPFIKTVLEITNKVDFITLIILTSCLFIYSILISIPNIKPKIDKIIKSVVVFDVISLVLIFLLDVQLITNNNIISITGSAVLPTYIVCGFYLIASIGVAVINFKNISIKHIPIISIIFLFLLLMLLFNINPYIIIISITITFVNYLMYFTIENPDVVMIEELTNAKNMVEKYNNDKSIFLFNMTQQIRNPLNMMEQYTESVLEEENIEVIKKKMFDIRNEQQKISHIINGALDLTTLDAKKIKIVGTKYNLELLLREIKIKIEKEAAKKNLEFRVNIDESLSRELYGDSIRLKQIINALLCNAIKYTKKGFVEFNVNSIVSFDVCRLLVTVKDSGIGISSSEIDKLFEKNNDNKVLVSDNIDDSDITLDIAKKMVNLIGGTITVQSSKDKGSEFKLVLDQKIVTTKNKVSKLIDEYEKSNDNIKILFVSDNESQRNFYNKKLQNIANVDLCSSSQSMLQKIRKGKVYSLIIIKRDIEKIDAVMAMKKLNKINGFKTPVIVLTNNKDEEKELLQYGFRDVIYTDFTQNKLVEKIRANLL